MKTLAVAPETKECVAVPFVIKVCDHISLPVPVWLIQSQLLAETEEGVKALASFDVVSFAGAALPVSFYSPHHHNLTTIYRMI